MQFVSVFSVQLGFIARASSIIILNLRDSTLRSLRAECQATCILFGLNMSGNEYEIKGKSFADLDFKYSYALELWDGFSPQPVCVGMHFL